MEIVVIGNDRIADIMDQMAHRIDDLKRTGIGQELSDWQVEDMHRQAPFTMRSRAKGTAATKIRPHSLYEMERSAQYQRGMRRVIRRHGKHFWERLGAWEPLTSTRPILRDELSERLVERVTGKVFARLRWGDITPSPKAKLREAAKVAKLLLGI